MHSWMVNLLIPVKWNLLADMKVDHHLKPLTDVVQRKIVLYIQMGCYNGFWIARSRQHHHLSTPRQWYLLNLLLITCVWFRDCRVVTSPCVSLLVHVPENVPWRGIASNVISQLMDAASRSMEADNVL
jgi:hypothetical protein